MGTKDLKTKISSHISRTEEIKAQLDKAKYQALVDARKLEIKLDDENHVIENVDLPV